MPVCHSALNSIGKQFQTESHSGPLAIKALVVEGTGVKDVARGDLRPLAQKDF